MEKIESENLLHRAFDVFLFNSKYEPLLKQGSATKATFSLVRTNTCCSHPLYWESELIGDPWGEGCCTEEAPGWSGIPAEDVPVDGFIPLDWMLYKAPSDGKWGEHEHNNFLPFDSSSPFSLGILGQGSDVLQVSYPWSWMACKSPDVHVIWQLITRCSSFETWRLIQNPDEVAGVEYVSHVSQGSSQGAADESWRGWGGSSESVSLVRIRWWTIALLR